MVHFTTRSITLPTAESTDHPGSDAGTEAEIGVDWGSTSPGPDNGGYDTEGGDPGDLVENPPSPPRSDLRFVNGSLPMADESDHRFADTTVAEVHRRGA